MLSVCVRERGGKWGGWLQHSYTPCRLHVRSGVMSGTDGDVRGVARPRGVVGMYFFCIVAHYYRSTLTRDTNYSLPVVNYRTTGGEVRAWKRPTYVDVIWIQHGSNKKLQNQKNELPETIRSAHAGSHLL